jgi:hypothetical protein
MRLCNSQWALVVICWPCCGPCEGSGMVPAREEWPAPDVTTLTYRHLSRDGLTYRCLQKQDRLQASLPLQTRAHLQTMKATTLTYTARNTHESHHPRTQRATLTDSWIKNVDPYQYPLKTHPQSNPPGTPISATILAPTDRRQAHEKWSRSHQKTPR